MKLPPELSTHWHQLYDESKALIEVYDNGIDRNAAVTHDYARIAQDYPIVTWFAAAGLGSSQVGEALKLVAWPVFSWMPSSREVYASFCDVNQEIHHNIVTQYRFYREHGTEGLEQLKDDFEDGKISEPLIISFRTYDEVRDEYLAKFQAEYGQEQEMVFNDSKVLKLVFIQADMINKAEQAAQNMSNHEQKLVQYRYFLSSMGEGLTLGTALQHSWIENWVTDLMGWGGPTIEGEYFSTTHIQWNDVEQRLTYFSSIFSKLSQVIEEDPSLEKLHGLLAICPSQEMLDQKLKAQQAQKPRGLVWRFMDAVFDPEVDMHKPKPPQLTQERKFAVLPSLLRPAHS